MTRDFNILIYWQQGVSLSRGSLRSQQWVGKARSGIRPHLWHWFSLGSCFSEPHALDHNKKMISTSLIKKINVSSTAESGPQRSLMSYLSISRKETLCYHVKSFLILKKYQKSKNFWKKSFHSAKIFPYQWQSIPNACLSITFTFPSYSSSKWAWFKWATKLAREGAAITLQNKVLHDDF